MDNVQRARVFIKNLPFSVTEQKLKEHYEKYGSIKEVSLLKKTNGHIIGCGFVQFETTHGALEAIKKTNDEKFLGRKISCQLAVYKERRNKKVENKIKEHSDPRDIKEEYEKPNVETEVNDITNEKNSNRKRKRSCTDETNQIDASKQPEVKNPKLNIVNDVTQGRTVFVKNVPFTATNDNIHNCFSQYGDLEYALVVKDKYTEHSKGTAFVKYINREDAEKCLEAGTELQIEGNILDCHVALSKQDLENNTTERLASAKIDLPIKKDKQRSKFPTNLHLLNEGAVLAGSSAATSVSSADMQLRLTIVQQRQRRLRNEPNLVISDRRLIVHNLPPEWTDRNILVMCKKYGVSVSKNKRKGKKCKGNAMEMKIMRNRDAEKSSKCYAYIGCETHKVALSLLRDVNNNPDAFGPPPSPHKRPIVYFSLEDRRTLHKLDKRHQNNTKKQNGNSKNNINDSNTSNKQEKKQCNKTSSVDEATLPSTNEKTDNSSKSNPLKTRLKHNPRRQLQLHREQIKQRKHKQRLNKTAKEHKNHQRTSKNAAKAIGMDVVSAKPSKGKGDDDFSKIVADYRNKLSAASLTATKTKWYES